MNRLVVKKTGADTQACGMHINGIPNMPDRRKLLTRVVNFRYIYLLLLPGLIYIFIFKLIPLGGLLVAFQDYNPFGGIWRSPWVGLANFGEIFASSSFFNMFRNTIVINMLSIIFFFPLPIALSVMLSEARHLFFRKTVQSIIYMPHFLSWVVIASITYFCLSVDCGVVNKILFALGGEEISFLSKPELFWPIITLQTIWRETGWGTIIFLASIVGINSSRYEAAVIDGASRLQQIYYVTLPGILPIIMIMLILRLGQIADVSLDQVLLMRNSLVADVAEVFDTYAFIQGVKNGFTSIGVAVGMLKGVINVVLVLASNYVIKKTGNEGIF